MLRAGAARLVAGDARFLYDQRRQTVPVTARCREGYAGAGVLGAVSKYSPVLQAKRRAGLGAVRRADYSPAPELLALAQLPASQTVLDGRFVLGVAPLAPTNPAELESQPRLAAQSLRKPHNFCVAMNWLPWPFVPKRLWPKIKFKEKRAIAREEHQRVADREQNPE
jgi:hypothetical protein